MEEDQEENRPEDAHWALKKIGRRRKKKASTEVMGVAKRSKLRKKYKKKAIISSKEAKPSSSKVLESISSNNIRNRKRQKQHRSLVKLWDYTIAFGKEKKLCTW